MDRFQSEMKQLPITNIELKRDIVITIPSTTKWSEYQKELDSVKDGKSVMNFKVSQFPKETQIGCKCYLCYKGNIIGYMIIVGMWEGYFNCDTTDKAWSGKFIQRSGEFFKINPIPMKGFQGFRYISL